MKAKKKLKKVLKAIKKHCKWCDLQMGGESCNMFEECSFYPYRNGKFTKIDKQATAQKPARKETADMS